MQFYNTTNKSSNVNFREAAIRGQAPGQGLYFPEKIPLLSADALHNLKTKSKTEAAFEIIRPYVGDDIPEAELFEICQRTTDFDFPLVKVSDKIYSLELFHGPTLAFKDVGARFMSGCLAYFSKGKAKKVTVLVATSGDTGSAVANGFLGVNGVDVVILYPSGKVSKIQELQLTTLGQNITALEVSGTFDDCQQMVKQAFADISLNQKLFLTSANSINIARWLPQQFYYFFAWQQWPDEQPPIVCVPSGNFGNICAGLLAFASGLPIRHFVAACNVNDAFTRYLKTGAFMGKDAKATVSNAMDVGKPSNFVRLLEIFNHDFEKIKTQISSFSISDAETLNTMAHVFKQYNYTLDPHGAVAYRSLENFLETQPDAKGYFLETAHPAKFNEVVEKAIGQPVPFPESMKHLLQSKKQSINIKADYNELKDYLLK